MDQRAALIGTVHVSVHTITPPAEMLLTGKRRVEGVHVTHKVFRFK